MTEMAKEATDRWWWRIIIEDVRGKVYIRLTTNAPWTLKSARVVLFDGPLPEPHELNKSDSSSVEWESPWNPPPLEGNWKTPKDYGPGWSAALLAKDGEEGGAGKEYYVATTHGVTE